MPRRRRYTLGERQRLKLGLPARSKDTFEHVFQHPQKYPKHEGTKGSVWGGECNVTRCDNHGAVFYNIGTRGYYCRTCADGINWQKDRSPLCIRVDHTLNMEEMDETYRTLYHL